MKTQYLYSLLTILLVILPIVSNAQQISGKVKSRTDGIALAFAHISSPESGEGTITDEHGNFTLLLKDITKVKTLAASFVGYKSVVKSVEPSTRTYIFELPQDTTYLKAVEVTPINPVSLLREAIKQVPNNHGGQRTLTCFYRMTTKNNDKYIQVSEASFMLNQGNESPQIRLLKAREAEDKDAFNGVGMGIGTPVDAAKNVDITQRINDSFLDESAFKKYEFIYEGVSSRNGVEVHEISFDQKKIRQSLYRGKIFLCIETLSFVSIEYELSPKGLPYIKYGNAAERAAMKLLNIDIDVNSQRIALDYRQFGERWYLHYVLREENVRVKSKRYNFDVPVFIRGEFLVTLIDTTSTETFQETEFEKKAHLESASDTTSSFWQNYNILPTTIDYNAIAKDIESRNGFDRIEKEVADLIKRLPKNKTARVDSVIWHFHKKGLFNGTALVKHKGKILVHKGYGYANKEDQILNDTTTIFRIGSVAKTFTSRLIWELEKDGLLKYSDSIQRFIPWYPHRNITIHHLLTHTSGIPNYTEQASYLDSITHQFTLEELVKKFCVNEPLFNPDTQFRYSNSGYTILALITEKAAEKSFGNLLQERIFTPLQMQYTYFGNKSDTLVAKGYWNEVEEPFYIVTNTAGAGSILSTTSDLLKWSDSHSGKQFDILFEPREWYHDWGSHYGYGWNIDKYQFFSSKKHTIQYHGGTDFGFKSILARQPDEDNVVILLNNTGEFPLFNMTDLILKILN